MASLLKLVDTKANKPGMNLMHYVVMASSFYDLVSLYLKIRFCNMIFIYKRSCSQQQAQKAEVDMLKFTDQLEHIEAAAR